MRDQTMRGAHRRREGERSVGERREHERRRAGCLHFCGAMLVVAAAVDFMNSKA